MRSIIVTLLSFASFGLLAQNWAQIGPYGGYFKDFIIHPTTGAIYTGSDDGGGVWKSEDSGISWTILTADFPNMTGWKLHINELNDDAIYACDVYSRYGLLISTDAGDTWTISNSGLDSDYDKMVSGIVSIDLDSLMISTGEAAASTPPRPGNGMFKSVNGGDSWTEAGLQGITVPCVGKNAFNTIFAGTEGSGLYYTNDFGDNWLIHPGIPSSAKIHEIDVWDNVVAVAAVEGIFLSSDYGITFTNTGLVGDINFDLTIHSISPEVEIFNSTFSGLQYYST